MILIETVMPDGKAVEPVVVAALGGGVNAVQLRDRAAMEDDLRMVSHDLRDVTRGRAQFIINDQPDIARELRLDGVHLPEAAFDIDRSAISWPFVVGRSIHTVEGAQSAERNGADYVVAGNIYETQSHPGKDGSGIGFLAAVCKAVAVPVLAVGGIAPGNISDCIAAGAAGVVVRSGIVSAADPAAAAERYWRALESAWEEKING